MPTRVVMIMLFLTEKSLNSTENKYKFDFFTVIF